MKQAKKILIVRTDRIGDVVLTLPLAEIIKRHIPEAEITFLLREYTAPLAEGNPFVKEVITLPGDEKNFRFFEALSILRSKKLDAAFVVRPRFGISLLLFLAGIPLRIGTAYRWYSFLFNKKIRQHRRQGDKHELEFNVEMLGAIGIDEKVSPGSVSFNVQPDGESKQKVLEFLKANGWKEELQTAIIHPGSGKSALDLPKHKFKEIIESLAHKLQVNLILTGSKEEKTMCEELNTNGKAIVTAGEFNLRELIALISFSDLMIANSTGPIHIAAALGKKTIGFYPNVNECSPKRWGPYSSNSFVFVPEKDCVSCKAVDENDCMETIPTEQVILKIEEFLNA